MKVVCNVGRYYLVVAGQGLLTLWKEQGPVLHCHFLETPQERNLSGNILRRLLFGHGFLRSLKLLEEALQLLLKVFLFCSQHFHFSLLRQDVTASTFCQRWILRGDIFEGTEDSLHRSCKGLLRLHNLCPPAAWLLHLALPRGQGVPQVFCRGLRGIPNIDKRIDPLWAVCCSLVLRRLVQQHLECTDSPVEGVRVRHRRTKRRGAVIKKQLLVLEYQAGCSSGFPLCRHRCIGGDAESPSTSGCIEKMWQLGDSNQGQIGRAHV